MIYRLKKKYGDSVEDMLDYLERCRKELDEIQLPCSPPFPDSRKGSIDKHPHFLHRLRQVFRYVRYIAGRTFVVNESHPVGSCLLHLTDVLRLPHAAHFDNHKARA